MSILQWNICGYRSKYPELKKLLTDLSPACVCLQETMLGQFTPTPPNSYTIITSPNHEPIPGQVLAFLIHTSIAFTPVQITTELQVQTIRAHLSKPTTICNIYLNPNQQTNRQSIENIILQLEEPFIMLGDFNAKHTLWGDDSDDPRGRTIEAIILDNNISILNTGQPTNFHTQTASLHAVDISLCSPQLLTGLRWSTLEDLHGSDHFPILIENIENNHLPHKPVKFNIKKAKWTDFKDNTLFLQNNYNMGLNDRYKNLIAHIQTAANICIPKTSSNTRTKRTPWWNGYCTQLCNERKQALRKYQRTKLPADRQLYQRARARAQYHIKIIKRESWKQYLSTININTPMSKVWTKIRKMTGKYPISHPPTLKINNELLTDTAITSQTLAEHFSSVSSNNHYSEIFNRNRSIIEQTAIDFTSPPANQIEEYNQPISINELNLALKSCSDSAPGEDQITYSMLKNLYPTAHNEVLKIMSKIWLNGLFPDDWRKAIVLSFPKPGKNPQETTSYRPIALTSSICKLMEKIVNVRLIRTLEEYNIISEFQFGFRKHRSTIDALLRLQTDILESFTRKEHLIAVFFDIEKAYDTAWRYHILKVIHQAGLRGHLPIFIQNFLEQRLFKTKIANSTSTLVPQEQGVPQGSVLSCSLFLLAINDILNNIPTNVKAALYVDDLVIYTSSMHIPSIERRLQNTIVRIEKWTSDNGFRFSSQKTIAVHFHRKRGIQREPIIHLYNNPIRFQSTATYLGMKFDQRLRWKEHIDHIKTKCTKSLDIIKCLSKTRWGSDRDMLMRLYRSLIRSKICLLYTSDAADE